MSGNVGRKEEGCDAKLRNSYFNLKAKRSYLKLLMTWSSLCFRKVLLAWRMKQVRTEAQKPMKNPLPQFRWEKSRIWDNVVRQSVIEDGTHSRVVMRVEVEVNSQTSDLNTRMDKGSIFGDKEKSKVLWWWIEMISWVFIMVSLKSLWDIQVETSKKKVRCTRLGYPITEDSQNKFYHFLSEWPSTSYILLLSHHCLHYKIVEIIKIP